MSYSGAYIPPHLRKGTAEKKHANKADDYGLRMSKEDRALVLSWAESCGAPDQVLQRPSAESFPNTFVFMWNKDVKLGKYGVTYIAIDVHYEGDEIEAGRPIKYLGGLWAKAFPKVNGGLTPQQDTEIGDLLRKVIPEKSPDPSKCEKFGKY